MIESGEDELLGSGTEEAIYKSAFKQGYDEGSQEGAHEGWAAGLQTGAEVGFELGKYKGFALVVREQSAGTADKEQRLLKLCDKIIKLVDEFSWENVESIHDATAQVRTHYNLLKSQVGLADETESPEGTISGQRFSF